MQVAWLTIPVITIFSGSTLLLHLLFTTSDDTDGGDNGDYRIAGILYCLASWIEGCGEPAVLFFLRKLEVPPRVEAEGIASVVKTMVTAVGIQVLSYPSSSSSSGSLTVFGLAQLMYSIAYTSYLYARAWSRPDWKAKSLPPGSLSVFWAGLNTSACYTTLVYTIQGFFKHALTEADKIILTAMADSYDKGVYAMGASYGGMAARILLQPLEENARLLWSRQKDQSQKQLLRSYTTLVKLVLYVGLVFGCVAVHYTNLLLNLLAGRTWGSNIEAASVLAAFCVYTAFLALNGMTEAFVYAVASGDTAASEMAKLGLVHTVTGLAFAAVASVLVTHYGTSGLVAANCVAMFIRSLYSLHYAKRYFSKSRSQLRLKQKHENETPLLLFSRICPHPVVLGWFASAWLATRWSLQNLILEGFHLQLNLRNTDWLLQTGQHVAIGLVFVVGIAVLAVLFDRSFIQSLKDMVRQRGKQRDSKSQEQKRPKQD